MTAYGITQVLFVALYTLAIAIGWGFLSPYFGLDPFSPEHILGLGLVLFGLRYFLATRVINIVTTAPTFPATLLDSLRGSDGE